MPMRCATGSVWWRYCRPKTRRVRLFRAVSPVPVSNWVMRLQQWRQRPAPAAASLKVRVELDAALKDKVQPGDAVFVFARALSGPPMPLAVKRLTVADLPAEVSLSDSDAMMPQLKLSKFPEVQLVARVSRAGNATAGEWIGRSAGVSSQSTEQQSVRISEADQR